MHLVQDAVRRDWLTWCGRLLKAGSTDLRAVLMHPWKSGSDRSRSSREHSPVRVLRFR